MTDARAPAASPTAAGRPVAAGPPIAVPAPALSSMPIQVLPGLQVIHGGYTVLVTRHDSSFEAAGLEGLYDFDTRILSRHVLLVDGSRPECVVAGGETAERWISHLRVPLDGGDAAGPRLPEDTLEIIVRRRLESGMAERITVANHGMAAWEGRLTLEVDADFVDVGEAHASVQRGRVSHGWDDAARSLTFSFTAERDQYRLERASRAVVTDADSKPACDGKRLEFELSLPPHGEWSAALRVESLVDGEWRAPPDSLDPSGDWAPTERDRLRAEWHARRARVGGDSLVAAVFERAAEDLIALRNWEADVAPDAWIPHAGMPTYTGVFGRDVLTAGWESLLLGPEMTSGALDVAARTQGRRDDAWRDEQPGRMIHEIRRGPLAELEISARRAYYGAHTTPAMFLIALSEHWHWTADDDVLRRYLPAAERAMEWARRYGDQDGDGFLEYQSRSPVGLRNQGWMDSDEAIRHLDGSLAEVPIATVEEQAFHCLALERMAEILLVLGDDAAAERYLAEAREFRTRWHEAFWMPEERFYAIALDRDKRQVRSIGSNPGHALGTGTVPAEHARAVADRLLAPDLFSGWGIRTLSTDHPSYNPYAYHLGSVWPVENATFALGFKRYGLDDHAERLAGGLLGAAGHFVGLHMPEVFGGHERRQGSIPTLYPRSNSPQAWSASAIVLMVQSLLGIYPFAAAGVLALIRPRLPEWLPELTLHNVRVGRAAVALRFERQPDGSATCDVVERDGRLFVVPVPPPADAGAGTDDWRARLGARLVEHAPGRMAHALRIAMGELG